MLLLAAPIASAGSTTSYASSIGQPLQVIGTLTEPALGTARVHAGQILFVDAPRRRMYMAYQDPQAYGHIATYDLRPRIPRLLRTGLFSAPNMGGWDTPYVTAFDSRRQRLVELTENFDVAGQAPPLGNTTLTIFDTGLNRTAAIWDLAKTLPGFTAFGITYSPQDDRLYVSGEFSESSFVAAGAYTFGRKPAGPVTSIVALEASSGRLAWVRPLPECQVGMFAFSIGGLIVRSAVRNSIYMACTTGGRFLAGPNPGQAGLLRLNITGNATAAEAARFGLDFFPVSGLYMNGTSEPGFASFDPATDRFFMQSLSPSTPGDWVFDGRLSSWVGFISAPAASDYFTGFNTGLGHLYIGTQQGGPPEPTDGLVVADGRQTPVPSGTFTHAIVASFFIATDSATRRLFVLPPDAATTGASYQVALDNVPYGPLWPSLDYDGMTAGVAEGAAVYSNYSSDANSYGAELTLVGGVPGALSQFNDLFELLANLQHAANPPGGTRALTLARISGVGLRPAGASAAAQAVAADINTTNDYVNSKQFGAWPYPTVSCLDSGSGIKPQSTDNNGSSADVTCDLATSQASGTSDATGVTAGLLHVGHATNSGSTTRDHKHGAITNVDADSTGISVSVPGVGQLLIGSVTAHMHTQAHGQPGTTSATYERTIEGIKLLGAGGQALFGPAACTTSITAANGKRPKVADTCQAIAERINPLTQTRLHVGFPLPELDATPKGAYAAVQQSEGDYLQERTMNDQGVIYQNDSTGLRPAPAMQLEVFNDSTERSRLLAQFAAVQGDSIFETTAAQSPSSGGGSVSPPTSSGEGKTPPSLLPKLPGGTTTTTVPGQQQPAFAAAPAGGLAGFFLLHRGLRDAVLMALILSLVAGAALLAHRRQLLLTAMSPSNERPLS